jgi:hypothetical protein
MMPIQALLALDVARERSREAAALADRRRTAELAAEEAAEHAPAFVARPGPVRRAAVGFFHLIEGGAAGVARAACSAASRLDGTAA